MTGPVRTAAELGPGDSLGTGIAALLSGVDSYYALDIFSWSRTTQDLVEAIAELYRRRADLPGDDEFPDLKPHLDSYRFPHELFDADALAASLSLDRVRDIARAVANPGTRQGRVSVQYYVPWHDDSIIRQGSVDAAFSQAVMEHVEDIGLAYRALGRWLRPNGFMSHQIDFRCHGLSNDWNGHWAYSDWMFRVARGRRPFLLNRQPFSAHLQAVRLADFEILCASPVPKKGGISRARLAPKFRGMSQEDLSTSGLFLVARRA